MAIFDPNFSAEKYISRLARTEKASDCKPPLPHLTEDMDYVMVSYCHNDARRVFRDLADLYENRIPFWYDMRLSAGPDWDDLVREKMTDPHCVGVIFYLSPKALLSTSVQTEMEILMKKYKDTGTTPPLKHFSVNLSDKGLTELWLSIAEERTFAPGRDRLKELNRWLSMLTRLFSEKAVFLSQTNANYTKDLIAQIQERFHVERIPDTIDLTNARFIKGNAYAEMADGRLYNGEFSHGTMNGYGVMSYPIKEKATVIGGDAIVQYDGHWKDGKWDGEGVVTYASGKTVSCHWKGNLLDGLVVSTQNGVTTYTNYQDGVLLPDADKTGEKAEDATKMMVRTVSTESGKSEIFYGNGDVYRGEVKDNVPHGHGMMTYDGGGVYIGDWQDGKYHGYGSLVSPNKGQYLGNWEKGERHGNGVYVDSVNDIQYSGTWLNGKRHGTFTATYADGREEITRWKDGEKINE